MRLYFYAALLVLTHCSSTPKDSSTKPNQPVHERGKSNHSSSGFETESAFEKRAHSRPAHRPEDHVAPGFIVKISTPADQALNGSFRIRHDGTLELPYRKKIDTDGLTWDQVKTKVGQLYQGFFKTAPNLRFNLIKKKYYVSVRGLVEKPGQYLVKKNTTLDELISKARGLQKAQQGQTLAQYVRIQQYGTTRVIKLSDYYNGSQEFKASWDGGDTVFFQSERGDVSTEYGIDPNYIQILGEVRSPGEYLYNERADFFYYLGKSGGPTSAIDPHKIVLVRQFPEGKKSLEFSMDEVDEIPKIQGGDILIVHADRTTPFERGAGIVATIVGILGSIATAIIAIVAL